MADAFTPYWGLTLPEVGASRDTWGTKLNTDLTALDLLLQALQPIGAMTDWAGGGATPLGWLLCDGSIYQIAQYPRLVAVIGAFYGGDGVTTFAVPDLRARVTVGAGSTIGDLGFGIQITLGEKIGDSSVVIQQANLPNTAITTSSAGDHSHPSSLTTVGGNHVHTGQTDFGGDHSHGYTGVAFHNGGQDVAGGLDSGINSAALTTTAGNHAHSFSTTVNGDHQHNLALTTDGGHTHTFSLNGSNAPLRTMPPMLGTNKIICCGPPSMQTLPSGLMASPLRGLH